MKNRNQDASRKIIKSIIRVANTEKGKLEQMNKYTNKKHNKLKKSVKHLVKEYEDKIKTASAPFPKPRTKRPVPLPRTKIAPLKSFKRFCSIV